MDRSLGLVFITYNKGAMDWQAGDELLPLPGSGDIQGVADYYEGQ